MKAENRGRMEFVRMNLQCDDNRRQIRRRRELWCLTLGLRQKFADIAVVIGGNQIGMVAKPTLRLFVMMAARPVVVFLRVTRRNRHRMVMVVIRRQ